MPHVPSDVHVVVRVVVSLQVAVQVTPSTLSAQLASQVASPVVSTGWSLGSPGHILGQDPDVGPHSPDAKQVVLTGVPAPSPAQVAEQTAPSRELVQEPHVSPALVRGLVVVLGASAHCAKHFPVAAALHDPSDWHVTVALPP